MNLKNSKPPNFDGNIVLMFPQMVSFSQAVTLFGINKDIQIYDNMLEMTYVEVKNICCWEVNDLLTELFSQCNFEILLLAQSQFNAKVVIDITFQHYDKYPALIFDGANMEKIHMLKADIAIDIY
ncbi:MAG: hypothetical protein IJX46_01720 [Clostridia bacterium]|nr:hypothetical protein [Clostridia bacterium]